MGQEKPWVKGNYCLDWIKKQDSSLCFLQDTWYKNKDRKLWLHCPLGNSKLVEILRIKSNSVKVKTRIRLKLIDGKIYPINTNKSKPSNIS